ncbi:MFS transporter [Oscillochloris sp. ZM17-4]|uniref:MFS transporter n=1 Tax=Oscillochloris sp. ZM17-4 TaxID=2866714 RepID=UPI001C729F27|nr:MFS transporter [Oscillochloris sp. ZM17-4]MBX0328452.1 MFS transporter [Oscillochloris sp. ZM17-4]
MRRFAASLERRGVFYGWVVVLVCFLVLCVNFGVRLSFGIFFEALTRGGEFGWARADTAGVFSLSVLVQAFTSALVGWLLDRFGVRWVFAIGLLVLGVGLALTSRITSLLGFYLAFGLVTGLGTAILGLTIHGTTVSRWFDRRGPRGLAIGLAYAGTGIGILLLAPLIERVIAASGWRPAYLLLSALALGGALPLSLLLLRDTPVELGLRPLGAAAAGSEAHARQAPERRWSFAEALRTPAFWLLMLAGLCSLYTLRMVTVHQVAHFVDRGVTRATAAAVFGGSGLVTAGSYIGFGLLSDRIGRERSFYLGAAAQALALIMLLALPGDAPLAYLYAYAVLWGVGEGSRSGLLTAIASDRFAGPQLGAIVGTLGAAFGLGAAIGSWAGGLIFDGLGSYTPAFLSALVATGVACGCVAIAKGNVEC